MHDTKNYKKVHMFLVENEIVLLKKYQLVTHIQYQLKVNEFKATQIVEIMIKQGYFKKTKLGIKINEERSEKK